MAIHNLLHAQEALRQLRILLGEVLVLFPQTLDAISLLVIAYCANVGRNEENRASKRRLKAQE